MSVAKKSDEARTANEGLGRNRFAARPEAASIGARSRGALMTGCEHAARASAGRRRSLLLLIAAVSLVVLVLGCIDLLSVTQPSYVAPAESFQITISFFAGDDGDADGSTRFGAVMLPVGFSVTGNTFCGSYSLTESAAYEAQLTSDYPPDPGYFWWVGTTTHNTATNNCDAVLDVTAGNTTGTYYLDYRAGYNTHYDDQILNKQLQVSAGDSDGDGMPDGWETTYNMCVNPSVADAGLDPDGDTYTNLDEYNMGTNPCVMNDTDGDGMPDHWEDQYACVSSYYRDDDLNPDSDSLLNYDEYLSSEDPCEFPDSDGDGMSDSWENGYACVDSAAGDSAADPDGDTFSNLLEFLESRDPCAAEDGDGDGMPDYWEDSYSCVSSALADADADPDNDYATNGQEHASSTNPCVAEDADGDAMPDGWEDLYPCVDSAVGDSTLDPDADTLDNMAEFIGGADPCVAEDGDGDGMPDWWEDLFACIDSGVNDAASDPDLDTIDSLTEYGNSTDPCSGMDTDGDGMPDDWEENYACVDSSVVDSTLDPDSDGHDNLSEFQNGTDPCDPCQDTDGDSYWVNCGYSEEDCDDTNPDIYPGAPELCDYVDNQCPGDPGYGMIIDEYCPYTCGDGWCYDEEWWDSDCPEDCGYCGDGFCGYLEPVWDTCCEDCGYCGDHICCSNETKSSCYEDCDSCFYAMCGDGTCECGENEDNCMADCCAGGCGDGCCEENEQGLCSEDCCGDGYCHFLESSWEWYGVGCCVADCGEIACCQDWDNDMFGIDCPWGDDCDDDDENAWDTCDTCHDNDGDDYFELCNTYYGIDGPDCDDGDSSINPGEPEIPCDGTDNDCDPLSLDDDGSDDDGDGLLQCQEVALGTGDSTWDSDGDLLPDPFEASNMSGHTAGSNLNPVDSADGPLDYDNDNIRNAHEYWNNTDPWAADPAPLPLYDPACYYWGDGDGDGIVGPGDASLLELSIAGSTVAFNNVIPQGVFDTLDLDKDGSPGPGDKPLFDDMLVGNERLSGYPSSPASLTLVSPPAAAVTVGDTTHITVSVDNASSSVATSGGFAVVFAVDGDSSAGTATLLGGEGMDLGGASGNRYDVSGASASGGLANIVVRVDSAGTVVIRVAIPGCGAYPDGRWCDYIELTPAITITGQ